MTFPGISYQAVGYGESADAAEGATGIEFEAIDVACAEGGVVLSDEPMIAGRSVVEAIQAPDEINFLVEIHVLPRQLSRRDLGCTR